jgi:hypothetical protein
MATAKLTIKKVLYSYEPELPYYFDQKDIIEIESDKNDDEVIQEICRKNSCKENEIKILGVFDNSNDLKEYCTANGLRYLT